MNARKTTSPSQTANATKPPYDAVLFDPGAFSGRVSPTTGAVTSPIVHLSPEMVQFLRRLHGEGLIAALVAPVGDLSAAAESVRSAALAGLIRHPVVDGDGDASVGDLLERALARLSLPPSRAVVIAAEPELIAAARSAGVGFVVGIERDDTRSRLEAAGADILIDDVGHLDLGLIVRSPWQLIYHGYDTRHEGHREALTTLGNGYLGVRGAAPECHGSGSGYPGTYLSGVYNRVVTRVAGDRHEDEQLVNGPNWLHLDIRLGGTAWWSAGGLRLREEHRVLDMRHATLDRDALLEDHTGRQLRVHQRRLVSMDRPHLAALETTITPVGWSGTIEVRSGVDLDVRNGNAPHGPIPPDRHLRDVSARREVGTAIDDDATLVAEAETLQSRIRIAVAMRTTVRGAGTVHGVSGRADGLHFHEFSIEVQDGVPVRVGKVVAIVSSKDRAIASAREGAIAELDRAETGFEGLLLAHRRAWRRLRRLFEVRLESHPRVQLVLNLHVFHLLQTLAPPVADLDTGVPARGLHGEGYRGRVFWDELFVLPLITSRHTATARALIAYRWRRLSAARDAAASAQLEGAMFPWQSASDGREGTDPFLFNPLTERYLPDHSHLQRHVALAVAFDAWQYFEATRDRYWLLRHGAELVIEVARLFASMAEHDASDDRFHIRGIMGPDEFHTGYPDTDRPGLDDNAYTNVLAAWICGKAAAILELVRGHDREDLIDRLRVRPAEPGRWRHLSRRMTVPFHEDGVISQFAGYHELLEFDWAGYRRRYHSIERLDLILDAEGDTPNRYKLAKQADALMLLYVLGEAELIATLAELGYTVTTEQLHATVEYYLARTANGSTLSRVTHASVLAAFDPEHAWDTFLDALEADLDDAQGGTTRTGIHLGAMAGTIDVLQRSFAGMRLTRDALVFAPSLPAEVRSIAFTVRYRDALIEITVSPQELRAAAAEGDAAPVTLRVGTDARKLAMGATAVFQLPGSDVG